MIDSPVNKVYFCELNGLPRIYTNFGAALVGILEISGAESYNDIPNLKIRNIVVDATAAGVREAGIKRYSICFDRSKKLLGVKEFEVASDQDLVSITNEAHYAYATRLNSPYLIDGVYAKDSFTAVLLAKQELERIINFFENKDKKYL